MEDAQKRPRPRNDELLEEPTLVGIWLDRRQAHVVTLRGSEESLYTLASGVEGRVRSGGRPPPETGKEKRARNRRRQQMSRYYEQIIQAIRGADAVHLFGPGEAKHGLQRALSRRRNLAGRLVAVETSGPLTPRQLLARVRQAYDEPRG